MSWLEVHVFGAKSTGEGIILKLPDDAVGVIDSCYSSWKCDTTPPMVDFLRALKPSSLAFVCLTHPHADHYFGMSQILSEFDVDEYWLSNSVDYSKICKIVDHHGYDAAVNDDKRRLRELKELERINETIRQAHQSNKSRLLFANVSKLVYPEMEPNEGEFRIKALSPCAQEVDKYLSALDQCFDSDNNPIVPAPKQVRKKLDPNRLSAALLLECGKFNVVLGSDTETPNWKVAIKRFRPEQLKSKLVKVSHHGSKGAYSDELWKLFEDDGKSTVAVVTNFKHQLPNWTALNQIRPHAGEMYLTHQSGLRGEGRRSAVQEFFKDQKTSDLTELEKTLNASAEGDPQYGRCSFYFTETGEIEKVEADSPAYRVWSKIH